jgi:hypothetical protein
MRPALCTIVLVLTLFAPALGWASSDLDQVRARVYAWREAWLMKDIALYKTCYHPAFRSGDLNITTWIHQKAQLFKEAQMLSVEIFGMSISLQGNQAVVRFVQRYKSPTFSDLGEKTLEMEKLDESWKIIFEQWRRLPADFKLPEPVSAPRLSKKKATAIVEQMPLPLKGTFLPKTPIERGLEYRMDANGTEKVYIRMNRFFIPIVFNIDGKKPRIVIDIRDVSHWTEPARLPVNGPLVRQIRSYLHQKQKKLRIVLDLNPSGNYYINQRYLKSDNIYCMEIR